jgi:DNA polymerase-3 subunit delta
MARRRVREIPASQVLADLRRRLATGWEAGLTVLNGDDLYHLDQAQRVLLDALVPGDDPGFALTVFGDEKVDVATIVAASRSAGMFASRRVVLVREIGALEGEADALTEFAAAPPPDSYLLIRAPALDQRRKLHKALATAGALLRFAAPSEAELGRLAADVAAIANEKGMNLDRDSTTLVAQLCGGDLYRAANELEKIRAWLGTERTATVGAGLVREVAAAGGLLSGWEVANAILLRDRPAALSAARRLVEAGDHPLRVIGGLAYRARVMLQAKAMLAAGRNPREVVQATRAWAYQDGLREGLSRYSLEELRRFPNLLLEADRTLKSRAIDPGAVLESLIDRMTLQDSAAAVES